MGNTNETKQETSSKSKLPFYSRDQSNDYSPLGDKDQLGKALKCSLKTRLIGFVVCCAIGWFISILGILSLVLNHNTKEFAIFYSMGQIINIAGSCFLATPKTQFKNMTHRTRIVLSILYLGAIVITLVLGIFLPENLQFLVFVSLVGQMVAYFFYTLSYIPFGRKILKKICKFLVVE